MSVVLLSMEGQKVLGFHQKYIYIYIFLYIYLHYIYIYVCLKTNEGLLILERQEYK